MKFHTVRRGSGKPLLLVHGIGGSWASWEPVIDRLAEGGREVIAVDLPGHGPTPPLSGPVSISTLSDAVTEFLIGEGLLGIDAVGSSMGARLVLELVRRGGVLGAVVSLDPGGFWEGWEVPVFYYSVAASVRLVRALQPVMPAITSNPIGRTALFAQFSAHPWSIPSHLALTEMRSFAASPSFDELLENLAHGEAQSGSPKGSVVAPLVIGWGEDDYVCLPRQATRAIARFPDAQLYWFPNCGHFPQWDSPELAARLILAATSGDPLPQPERGYKSTLSARMKWALAVSLAVAVAAVAIVVSVPLKSRQSSL